MMTDCLGRVLLIRRTMVSTPGSELGIMDLMQDVFFGQHHV